MADRRQNRRNNGNKDEDYNPKFRKMRKKVCPLCANKELVLDYKNADQLKKFIRATGACAKHQRDITIAVKRARQIAILPYTQE